MARRAKRRQHEEPLFDPHEFGARRSDPALGAFEPLPPTTRRFSNKQLLVYFFLGVLVIAVLRIGKDRVPPVDGSCTKPAFALNKDDISQYGVLKWSAAGPATSSIVFGIDVKDTTTVPSSGATLLTGPVALSKCKASGLFGVRVAPGDHVLSVFLIDRAGTSTVIGTQKISVEKQN